MIKCDVCGDINRNGVSLPAGWKSDKVEELCQKCVAELDKELAPIKRDLQEQLNRNAQMVLARMQAQWAIGAPTPPPPGQPDPGCGADECVPTCNACDGGDDNATSK